MIWFWKGGGKYFAYFNKDTGLFVRLDRGFLYSNVETIDPIIFKKACEGWDTPIVPKGLGEW